MKNSVRITVQPALLASGEVNPNAGKVFTQSLKADGTPKLNKNEEPFGYIRVVAEKVSLSFTKDSAIKTRSALKSMTVAAWEKSKHMLTPNAIIEDHKIVRIDSLTPFYPGDEPVQIPVRDKDNNVIKGEFRTLTSGGAPVYRQEKLTERMSDEDQLLTYDTVVSTVGTGVASGKDKSIA